MTASTSPGSGLRARHGVNRDRRRLDERARAVVHGVRQREQHPRIDHDALRVGARAPRPQTDAVRDRRGAHLLGARAARRALAALGERQDADTIAGAPARDALADCRDGAGELVTRHGPGREQRRDIAEVEVRAADPAAGDIDCDLPRAGRGRRALDDPQQPILADFDRAHGAV